MNPLYRLKIRGLRMNMTEEKVLLLQFTPKGIQSLNLEVLDPVTREVTERGKAAQYGVAYLTELYGNELVWECYGIEALNETPTAKENHVHKKEEFRIWDVR